MKTKQWLNNYIDQNDRAKWICPNCESRNLIHFIYGYRNFLTDEDKIELESGNAVFAGCPCKGPTPDFECRDCKCYIGKGPLWEI